MMVLRATMTVTATVATAKLLRFVGLMIAVLTQILKKTLAKTKNAPD